MGRAEPFSIERPSDILRRRLMVEQDLPRVSEASLGADQLKTIQHWPEKGYPSASSSSSEGQIPIEPNKPVRICLTDALQIAARNSATYQAQKESVFQTALSLDLTRNNFRNIFRAAADAQVSANANMEPTQTTLDESASADVTRTLKNGIDLTGGLAVSLANLLTGGSGSTLGLTGDASVSIPLLRGAGRHIASESLVQAERNLMYAIWEFERYKRTFAVSIAREYFNALRQMDSLANAQANYRSAVQSARFSRRRADAGRMAEIEVDQAVQRELSARNQWISAQEQLKSRLDAMKNTLGLPTDALIELDPNDLTQLRGRAEEMLERLRSAPAQSDANDTAPQADAPVELVPANYEDAGPFEIEEALAVRLAFENRVDLLVALGEVYDAQRQVVVRADALRAELNLGGSASLVDNDDDGRLRFDGGRYAALLSFDLPIERTSERNAYRNSLISLERAVRAVQTLEDQVKLSIREALRGLLESRESLKIQAQSVVVAEKRVKSSTLFLEAGRIQIRDLLDAQDAFLDAQNSLTSAFVNYRIAELELQRDLDVLQVNEQGLWQEFSPKDTQHDSTT